LPQIITKSAMALVAEADAAVRVLDISEARALHGRDDVTFIDLRDIREVAKTGKIAGAHHVPRGMLEFWIDPASPYHKPFFAEDKTFVFYCAGGWRSALAAKTAQDMGLKPVAHLAGGMKAWIESEGPIDPPKERGERE
jgi:rhodanese-related sulfurtransferase